MPAMYSATELTRVIERLATCATFAEAVDFLAEWARGYALCDVALVRMAAEGGESGEGGPWIPVCGQQGATPTFRRDETFVAARECMCGRVMLRDVNVELPFFTPRGSFVWGRVSSLGSRFSPEQIGPMRGRCVDEGFESLAIFAILDQGRPVGVLHLADRKPDHFQDSADLIEEICEQAGSLLLKHQTTEFQRSVTDAIQAALLPNQPPRTRGLDIGAYFASAAEASQIGGDFYDVLEPNPGEVLLIVGDYSGKGLEAAGMATRARYTLSSLAVQAQSPADLFDRANDRLATMLPHDRFVSAVACLIRPASGELRMALAGHPAPLFLKEVGDVEELNMARRPPLGAFAETIYTEALFQLQHSDVLLLYTDGVTEARRHGDFFGVSGIAGVWAARRAADLGVLARDICRAAGAFHDRPDSPDDRLVLAAQITPAMVSLIPDPSRLNATMAAR
ncbi:MAG: serine/threonine-protein phosphatase [Actinobacteria bacterium]|nr:serine/threonine-protein phosphatase [Actinomycetota bacterium]